MEKALNKTETYLLYALILLFPITALSISPNPFVVSKLAVLVFGLGLILLVRVARIFYSGKLEFAVGKYDLPVLVLVAAYILSTMLRTPNKMEALLLPGVTTAVIGGALLYFLINQLKATEKKGLIMALTGSGALFSILTIFASIGLFEAIPQLPAYIRARSFTPEGGHLPGAIFLLTLLPSSIGLMISEKNSTNKILTSVGVFVMAAGLLLSVYNIIPGRDFAPRFPGTNVSWQIGVESLKESPLLGVGPGNYLTAFNRWRPLTYNYTDLWAVKFATASNFYLTLLTEVGLLGLVGIIMLVLTFYKDARKDLKERKLVNWGFAGVATVISLILLLIIFAIFPATILLVVLLFIYLSLNAKTRHTSLTLTSQAVAEDSQGFTKEQVASRFPAILITLPIVIFVLLISFRSARILQAEYRFKQSLDALVANDAQGTYDLMRNAIEINPTVDRYHATFSRINLILANSIAQNEEITDDDRVTITQLVQQAISEGKATVALNPLRAGNWEVLARTYQAIIPFAEGADVFAVQTFAQAIALDPLNPNLRIALGGIYFAAGDYENAVSIFNLVATQVKSDLANAHYNLAFALRERGEMDAAVLAMSNVVAMVQQTAGRDSEDYRVATQALEEFRTRQLELSREGTDSLTPPEEGQEPVLEPPLELPEDAEPPESPIPAPAEDEDEDQPIPTPIP
jgi:tetratricopeptide (TPR) repeat protein